MCTAYTGTVFGFCLDFILLVYKLKRQVLAYFSYLLFAACLGIAIPKHLP